MVFKTDGHIINIGGHKNRFHRTFKFSLPVSSLVENISVISLSVTAPDVSIVAQTVTTLFSSTVVGL